MHLLLISAWKAVRTMLKWWRKYVVAQKAKSHDYHIICICKGINLIWSMIMYIWTTEYFFHREVNVNQPSITYIHSCSYSPVHGIALGDVTVKKPISLASPCKSSPDVSIHWKEVWFKHLFTVFMKRPPGICVKIGGNVAPKYSVPFIFQIDGDGRNPNGHGINTSVSFSALDMFLGSWAWTSKSSRQ